MTLEEKYHELMMAIGLASFHPFQDNYYAPFASFGDSLSPEIGADAERVFKASPLYAELMKQAQVRQA